MVKAKMSFEEWVEKSVKGLAVYFNFGGWRINVEYKEDNPNTDGYHGTSEGYVYAETHVDSAYLSIHITLYKQAKDDFESGNLDQLSMVLTHELVHVFLDPFHTFVLPHLSETTTPFFTDMVENQTQKLTMVLLKTMPKEIFPPRTKHGKHD